MRTWWRVYLDTMIAVDGALQKPGTSFIPTIYHM
jgi:hypothetical protein